MRSKNAAVKKLSRKLPKIPTRFGFVRKSATRTPQLLKFMTTGGELARICAIAFLTRFLRQSRSAKVQESACQLAGTLSSKSTAAVCGVVRYRAKVLNLRSNFPSYRKFEKWQSQVPKLETAVETTTTQAKSAQRETNK